MAIYECPFLSCDETFQTWDCFLQHIKNTHPVPQKCDRPGDHDERKFVDGYCCHCGELNDGL